MLSLWSGRQADAFGKGKIVVYRIEPILEGMEASIRRQKINEILLRRGLSKCSWIHYTSDLSRCQ